MLCVHCLSCSTVLLGVETIKYVKAGASRTQGIEPLREPLVVGNAETL